MRQILFALKADNWSKGSLKKFTQDLGDSVLNSGETKAIGLTMHFIEIFLEEVAKVSEGQLAPALLTILLEPFINTLAFSSDLRIMHHIKKFIFVYLIRQSDLGLDYKEKYEEWKKLGFPGSIKSMVKVQEVEVQSDEEVENEEIDEKIYDPRAGRVNVDLPQLKFHGKAISKALLKVKFSNSTNSKSRTFITDLSEWYFFFKQSNLC